MPTMRAAFGITVDGALQPLTPRASWCPTRNPFPRKAAGCPRLPPCCSHSYGFRGSTRPSSPDNKTVPRRFWRACHPTHPSNLQQSESTLGQQTPPQLDKHQEGRCTDNRVGAQDPPTRGREQDQSVPSKVTGMSPGRAERAAPGSTEREPGLTGTRGEWGAGVPATHVRGPPRSLGHGPI